MSEHVIAWLFATMLLILLAASGTTHWLIARRGATPTLANLRARVFCPARVSLAGVQPPQ